MGKDLICKFYNDTAIEDKFKSAVCTRMTSHNLTDKACEFAFKHMWQHEASEEHCPGFPAPWEPFKWIHDALHKIWCFGLEREKDIEPDIEKEVCDEKSKVEKWACDESVEHVWKHLLDECNITNTIMIAAEQPVTVV